MVTRVTSQASQTQVDEIVNVVNTAYAQQNFRSPGTNRTDSKEIHRLIKDRHYRLFVLSEKVNGKVIGTIGLNTQEGTIGLFSVLPGPKYKGMGKILLEHAEKMFLVYSFPKQMPLQLEVFPSQDGLIAYYVKNGFTPTDRVHPIAEEHKQCIKPEYQHFTSYTVLKKEFPLESFQTLIHKG